MHACVCVSASYGICINQCSKTLHIVCRIIHVVNIPIANVTYTHQRQKPTQILGKKLHASHCHAVGYWAEIYKEQ